MTNSINNIRQTPYEEILACNEGHLALTIAIDVSGSMNGPKLQTVIDGIERFKKANSSDPLTLKRVDVSILTFGGDKVEVIQDWIPLVSFLEQPPLALKAGGQTPMGEAIIRSIDLTSERNKLYFSIGCPAFTPMVMLITDGIPSTSLDEAKQKLRKRQELQKLRFFCCGVGENTDLETLASISKRVIQCTDEKALSGLFDWMTESVSIISQSKSIIEGDEAQLPPLPQGLSVVPVPSDW